MVQDPVSVPGINLIHAVRELVGHPLFLPKQPEEFREWDIPDVFGLE
jgi:hypothetical protein